MIKRFTIREIKNDRGKSKKIVSTIEEFFHIFLKVSRKCVLFCSNFSIRFRIEKGKFLRSWSIFPLRLMEIFLPFFLLPYTDCLNFLIFVTHKPHFHSR